MRNILISSLIFLSACSPAATEQILEDQAQNEPITQEKMFTPKAGDTIAIIKTSHGDMKVLIHTEKVPETAKNFVELANEGKYNEVPFHRIIEDFMIQGGDFERENGTGGHSYKGPRTQIEDEFHPDLKHQKGALSMANSGPNTNGSQFFIVHSTENTQHLNNMHSVFGYIFDGMDIVDTLATLDTDHQDRPEEPAFIETVEILEFTE